MLKEQLMKIKIFSPLIMTVAASFSTCAYGVDISVAKLQEANECWQEPTWQQVVSINIPHRHSPVAEKYLYRAKKGYHICWVTTNENNANPEGVPISFLNKTRTSAEINLELGCGSGGIPADIIGSVAGYVYGGDTGAVAGDAVARVLASKVGNDCGVGGTSNWFEGNAVFILRPEGESCEATACQANMHPRPFYSFPQ